jgi:hypothetical protein
MIAIIDDYENEWPIRSFIANILRWFRTDKFTVEVLSYTEDFSMSLYTLSVVAKLFEFLVIPDEIRLSYNYEEEYLEYFLPKFVSWYANCSGITVQYGVCLLILISYFHWRLFFHR